MSEISDLDMLLSAYVAGECTQTERVAVERWLAESLDAQASFERLARARVSVHAAESPVDAERMVAAVLRRVGAPGLAHSQSLHDEKAYSRVSKPMRPFGIRMLRSWTWGAVALGAVLLVGVMSLPQLGRVSAREQSHTHRYTTKTGERAVVTLGDGTQMTLAPRTTVLVSFSSTHGRTVILDGEAYFVVAQSAKTPFVVQTGVVHTRVLGTTFWVRHYAESPRVQVAVVTGKVAVTAQTPQRPTIMLAAGMVGEVTPTSAVMLAGGDLARYGSWVYDQLVFRDTPMPEVLLTLERWYGYRFRLADSALAQGNLTAVLSTQSASDAFASLQLLLDVNLTVDDTIVTLTPRSRRTQMYRIPQQRFLFQEREVGR